MKKILFSYKVTYKDEYALRKYMYQSTSSKYITIACGVFGILISLPGFLTNYDPLSLFFIILGFCFIFYAQTFLLLWVKNAYKKATYYQKDFKYEIDDKEIKLGNSLISFKFSWELISHFKDTKDYLFLKVKHFGGVAMKKTTLTEEQKNALLKLAKEKTTH